MFSEKLSLQSQWSLGKDNMNVYHNPTMIMSFKATRLISFLRIFLGQNLWYCSTPMHTIRTWEAGKPQTPSPLPKWQVIICFSKTWGDVSALNSQALLRVLYLPKSAQRPLIRCLTSWRHTKVLPLRATPETQIISSSWDALPRALLSPFRPHSFWFSMSAAIRPISLHPAWWEEGLCLSQYWLSTF